MKPFFATLATFLGVAVCKPAAGRACETGNHNFYFGAWQMQITCAVTGESREVKATPKGLARLPRGWKRVGGHVYSAAAWSEKYTLRAIVVPVMPAVEGDQQAMRVAWKELDATLSEAWSRSTEAANWAVKTLLANDVTREPGATKMPAMPPIYLYGLRSWLGWAGSANSVLRSVEAKYRAMRYQTIWLGRAVTPNYRYPFPYPMPAADWKLTEEPEGGIHFSARLPDSRITVRVKGGRDYRRQTEGLRHLIANPDHGAEAALYRRGGKVVLKVVGWFPRKERRASPEMLRVRTDGESLLIALDPDGGRLWTLNADRVRRELVKADRARQRWREDRKAETRQPKRLARRNVGELRVATRKHRDRLSSWIDEAAANVVNFAARRGLKGVSYDDSDRSFCEGVPWARLSQLIEEKCRRDGLDYERSGGDENTATSRGAASPCEITL